MVLSSTSFRMLGSETCEQGKRGDAKHLRECRDGKYTPVGVTDHRSQRVIHSRPAHSSQDGN